MTHRGDHVVTLGTGKTCRAKFSHFANPSKFRKVTESPWITTRRSTIRINTNAVSTFSIRALHGNWSKTQSAEEHLASGSRINHGSEDAAGLSVSEKSRSNIRGLGQAERNIQDAYGLSRTAEGALAEMSNTLTRLRELAMQAASDTVGASERKMVDFEVQQLKTELARVANSTEYNGVYPLSGEAKRMDIQIGIIADEGSSRLSIDPREFDVALTTLGLTELSVATKEQAGNGLDLVDGAINRLNESRSNLGSLFNRLDSSHDNLLRYRTNISAADSRIRDADFAEESAELMKSKVITQANTSVLAQANQTPSQALKLL